MIVEMKKVLILGLEKNKNELLEKLRDIGVVHVSGGKTVSSAEAQNARKNISDIEKAISIIEQYEEKNKTVSSKESANNIENIVKDILSSQQQKETITNRIVNLRNLSSELEFWGNVDSVILSKVSEYLGGFKIAFIQKKDKKKLLERLDFLTLGENKEGFYIALLGDDLQGDLNVDIHYYKASDESLDDVKEKINNLNEQIKGIDENLLSYSSYANECKDYLVSLKREAEFIDVCDLMNKSDNIVYLNGYIPVNSIASFKSEAEKISAFGYVVEDVSAQDNPPTMLKNGKFASLISPIISMLALSAGYRERDISFLFTLFFSVFFAFIIGDAAYGIIFMIAGFFLFKKQKKMTNTSALVILLGFFTLIWGAMTGTWFASTIIFNTFPFLKMFVVKNLASFPELFGLTSQVAQNSMMRLCFSIGAFQLLLACMWNVVSKASNKDLSLFADIGWFMIITSMYFIILYLLVSNPLENVKAIIYSIACGFVLIVLFGSQKPGVKFSSGFKQGLGGMFTTFLNIISSFGNVMSYIRLFAVGMASVAIGQSFNGIAESMSGGVMMIAGIAVLVLGHALNLVMGLLSVVVHGVRLNVMEFSNQLGIEWSGYEYHPFS